ncbi:fibrinogen-like protein 1 [Rhopilema esculentum]|uniref:fibrinogen-like protein 1 n=1 Tax=Rhopilema esculentum TaxID=499914 RepID=UPI0031DF7C2F
MISSDRMANILALLCLILGSTATILRLPCLEYGYFTVVKKNAALQGSVIATISNTPVEKCQELCLLNPYCQTVNTKDDGTLCELSSKSRYHLPNDALFVEKIGWTYRATNYSETLVGELCQELKPCRHGYICKDTCSCPGYQCAPHYTDCGFLHKSGFRKNGIYPYRDSVKEFLVYCDFITLNKWWIVFQRRVDRSVTFYRNWNQYKQGFGEMSGNFWLGLEKIHKLVPPGRKARLRIELKHILDRSKLYYAEYEDFSISDEADGYRLHVGTYRGNAGDSLGYSSNRKFSTYDRDNDIHEKNCAVATKGAWWFGKCKNAHLNAVFPPLPYNDRLVYYLCWHHIDSQHGGVFYSEMKFTYL